MNQDSKSGQISYPKVNYGELLLPENDCKTSSAVNVPKNDQIFGHLETNQRPEPQDYFFFSYALLHMNLQKYKNWFGHLIGAYSKRPKY